MADSAMAPLSRIHFLGIGNLGKFVSHSLRKTNPPEKLPITLLFHRKSLVDEWDAAGRTIEVNTEGVEGVDRRGGFDYEVLGEQGGANGGGGGSGDEVIRNLVVATKTYLARGALEPLRKRLTRESTILFLQNGMGTIEEVRDSLFKDPSTRPSFLAGIISHGVYRTGTFSSVHAGIAISTVGPVADPDVPASTSAQREFTLMEKLISECPTLVANTVPAAELLQVQLKKLAVNSIVNPLSTVFDCINGDLFTKTHSMALIDLLMDETSKVESEILKRTGVVDQAIIDKDFSPQALLAHSHRIGTMVAKNVSSMRQDALAGRKTEIDYINGYIVARGEEFGIPTPANAQLVQWVKEKKLVTQDDIAAAFGFA